MKYYKLFLFLFLSTTVTSQIDFSASTLSGYESNINKSPNSLEVDNELLGKEDLHINSAYQDLILRLKYSKEWGKNSFTAYLTPEIRYYFSETEANQTIVNTRFLYKYDIKKNFRWENSFRYKVKDREGQDLDENELSLPFGYKLVDFCSGLRFRMYKENRTFVKLNIGSKKFDNTNTRAVKYNFYGITSEFKNIKWRNHLLHSYGVELGYTNRDYDITDVSNNTNSNRTWQYFDAAVFYRLPISKQWYIQPKLSYQKREDTTNDTFGYNQIRPELLISYKSEKVSARFTTNYTKRNFDSLNAENIFGDSVGNLEYDYWRVRANVEYKFNQKLSFVGEGYLIDRASNNTTVETTAFRSYANSYIGVGLKYSF